MIRTALQFIQKELEAYIVSRENDSSYTTGHVVDLKPPALPNGNINLNDATHITIIMVGVEEERREGKRPYYVPTEDKQFLQLNPPVEVNLNLLFIANNSNYETALRDLSNVICFFQSNYTFDEQRYPSLNGGATDPNNKPWQLIERLSFQMLSLSFEQQNNLWGMLGPKYIPSIVYRMKMLTAFDTKGKEKAPAITELNLSGN